MKEVAPHAGTLFTLDPNRKGVLIVICELGALKLSLHL